MGNLFDFMNYNKPGPGVEKDEPPKPRIIVFFQIYATKFWELVKLNMIFLWFNIPALVLGYFLFAIFYATFENQLQLHDKALFSFIIFFAFGSLFLGIPVITTGPAQAGFTYVLRNYSRREHAFMWSDFKEHAVSNLKQSLLITIIDFLVVLFLFIDFYFCVNSGMNRIIVTISLYLIALLSLIFLMMHLYIYPMLVTFKLSIKHIYKNAFIFAIARFLPNLGIVLLCFVLLVLPILLLTPIGIILFIFISLSTVGLITNFYAFTTLEKYMLNKD